MAFNFPVKNASNTAMEPRADGIPEVMKTGLGSRAEGSHPLMTSEKNFLKNREQLNMVMLRNTQGLHAPMRLQMEFKAARLIGRLPFLQSSNAMLDSLTGRDIEILPEDIFNVPDFQENIGQPHAIIEKSLGIL